MPLNKLVIRLSDPADRRIVLVRSTPKGEEQIKETEAHFFDVFKGLAEHLGKQDTKELIRLLRTSLTFLKEEKKFKKRLISTEADQPFILVGILFRNKMHLTR